MCRKYMFLSSIICPRFASRYNNFSLCFQICIVLWFISLCSVISHLQIILFIYFWVLHRNTFFIFWVEEFGVLGWCCFLILGLFKKFEVEISDVLFFQIPYGFRDGKFLLCVGLGCWWWSFMWVANTMIKKKIALLKIYDGR